MAKGRTGVCVPVRQVRGGDEAWDRGETVLEKKAGSQRGKEGVCWGLCLGRVRRGSPHRLDVTVQEAHGVDGLNGLQDLLAQPQRGAQREGASRLTAAQVSQVPALGVGGG